MFWKKAHRDVPARHARVEHAGETSVRRAENGSEMLYGLAQQLEQAGKSPRYVQQVRDAAHAIIDVLEYHPAHNAGPAKYREDSLAAGEHATELQQWFQSPAAPDSDREADR